jgi:photosystem II stability/assembly factor-like uncharacterized protein
MAERLLVGTRQGLALCAREDGGFRELRRAFAGQSIGAVAADAARGLVVAGTPDGVFRSEDGGESFSRVEEIGRLEARYVHLDRESGDVFVGTHPDVAVHVGRDGARRWEKIDLRARVPAEVRAQWVFHPFPSYGPHVKSIATCQGRLYVNVEEGWCYRSDDGGASFEPLLHGGLNVDAHVLAVHPRDRERVYSTDAFGACWSRDGGRSWARIAQAEQGPRRYGGGMAVHPQRPEIVLFSLGLARVFALGMQGARSTIFRSADGGESWSRVREGLPDPFDARVEHFVFDAGDDPHVYALTDLGEVLEGSDGGGRWRAVARVEGGHSSHYALGVM